MIELKTPGEIDAIRATGRVVAVILAAVQEKAAPGVRPRDLDALARDLIADAGAVPSLRGSVTSRTRSERPVGRRGSGCSPTTAGTASAARCTRIRTSPTKAGLVAA